MRPDFQKAAEFIWLNARLLDRHRLARHFLGGSREQILAALRPFQNDDGGFGNGLEPDLRAPTSQPQPVEFALHVLDEIDAFEDPMVAQACDYLSQITTAEGGVPFVLASASAYPCTSRDCPPSTNHGPGGTLGWSYGRPRRCVLWVFGTSWRALAPSIAQNTGASA